MLKITRKFDYAMVLMTDLGLRGRTPTSARRISQLHGLSPSLSANVLKGLQRSELVRSARGVRGGYVLAREPREITIASILISVEGNRRLTNCQSRSGKRNDHCPAFPTCPTRNYIAILEKKINALFEEATLADVLSVAKEEKTGEQP